MLLTFRALNGLAPIYTVHRRHASPPPTSAGVTISRQQRPLQVPSTSNRYGDRTFAASAPRLWNPLPRELKGAATRYVVIEPMTSCECYRTMPSGREPRTSSHTLRVDRGSRSDTRANVKVVQIVYCS